MPVRRNQFQYTPQQTSLIQSAGGTPQQMQELARLAQVDLGAAQDWMNRGPEEGSALEAGNPFWSREYNQALKSGQTPEQAAAAANSRINANSTSRFGEPTGNIMDFYNNRFGSERWVQEHIDSGFFGPSQPGSPSPATPQAGPFQPPLPPPGLSPNPTTSPPAGAIPPSAPPGQNAPFPNQGAVTPVGQDPLSQGIEHGLGQVIGAGGGATSGIGRIAENSLASLIGQGGGLNQDILNARLESAGEELLGQERQALSSLEARLADRNLNSGAFAGGLQDLTQRVQGQRARTTRDIFADESTRADQRLMGGLNLGAGLAQSGTQNLLGATGQGTQRQNMLGQLALQNLAEQNDFAQFLAEFGLSRDQVLADIEQGRFDRLLPFLNLFFAGSGQAAQGYIGSQA